MSNLSRMQGSPWHVERMERGDGDERRHRSRCIYFNKHGKHCVYYNGPCYGSAHCNYYKEGNHKKKEFADSLRKKNEKVHNNNWPESGTTNYEMVGVYTETARNSIVTKYSKVTLRSGEQEEFTIIIVEDGRGDPFSDPMKISETAALGRALMRHKEGDTVQVMMNDEVVKYKIVSIG
ncbi:MAG: GreA/GreB family elongation factor [Eubacterium sp.]|nr:GreA/GreB family elongation factor [Eubacterium sp.]MCH4078618.1 GreA/GreB family elongation factor [Eubacterium sp.]MCH4109759.1 GreA/GreB family elongation factor [Eubacterium sp.]MCI1306967.1 GreA/GreB family elongation factor [Eubacterium sp.]MCI1428093.1 GreA/GreB family elongation factor [Eubacterium sp.]